MTRRHAATTRALLMVAMLATGCGDDEPSGPSENFDLVGPWQWRINNATDGTASCTVVGVTLTFTEPGGVLTGHGVSAGGGNITCTINGSSQTNNFTFNDALEDLSFTGTSIGFSFETIFGDWTMTGTVTNDNLLSGTGTIRMGSSAGVFELTGPWTATRTQ